MKRGILLNIILLSLSLLATAAGQGVSTSVDVLIHNLGEQPSDMRLVGAIQKTRNPAAIPALKDAFERNSSSINKQLIAVALIALGCKDAEYFRFLNDLALDAVTRPTPFPLKFEPSGEVIQGAYSTDFLEWCLREDKNPGDVAGTILYSDPATVLHLAEIGDVRAVPTLLKALTAKNYYVAYYGALGLAKLKKTDAMPAIVSVCQRAPSSFAALIAETLIYFRTSEGDRQAGRFIGDSVKLEKLKSKAAEKDGL